MNAPGLPGLRLDASGVGRCTIAVSELLDRRSILAFAAAVGAGGSRMSADGPDHEPCPHPALAFRLQFLAQRRLDVAPSGDPAWLSAVHAESDLRILRPFRVGDVITTQGQVIVRRQIKPGVLNIERYRMTDGQGRLCAELDFHLIFRGATLTGAPQAIADIPPVPCFTSGDTPGARVIAQRFVPREALHIYTACSGIYAAIHTDPCAAHAAGFSDIILQGSATKAFALTAIIDAMLDGDATRVRRLRGRLKAAIPADTAFSVVVTGVAPIGPGVDGAPEEAFWFDVLNHAGEPAISQGCIVATTRGTCP